MNAQLALVHYPVQAAQVKEVPPHQRLYLYPHELYRVPSTYRQLRVVSGMALITQAARDLILRAGQTVTLEPRKDAALVSALRGENLVLELY